MIKVPIYTIVGTKTQEVNLPKQFHEKVRSDLIQKAVLVIQNNKRQPYGTYAKAGQRQAGKLSRRRRDYKTSYGIGISRVPRKVLWKRGKRFGWVGAFAPGMVGGRRANPPKATKDYSQKINIKERRKAIRSAMSATVFPELVKLRGHKFTYLINVVEDKLETLSKTKDVISALIKLGLEKELTRLKERKIRSGQGKNRGRKYKTKVGPLIVVSKTCQLQKSADNIPGVDICVVKNLNTELLAPGTQPGRLTIFTKSAIDAIEKESLFMNCSGVKK